MEQKKLMPVEYVIKKLQMNLSELARILGVTRSVPTTWIKRHGKFPRMSYKSLLREYAKNTFDIELTLEELNDGGIL